MIMDLATGGELFNLVTKNPGDCATEMEIRRMLTNMLSAVRIVPLYYTYILGPSRIATGAP